MAFGDVFADTPVPCCDNMLQDGSSTSHCTHQRITPHTRICIGNVHRNHHASRLDCGCRGKILLESFGPAGAPDTELRDTDQCRQAS
jgi:hypothetical protein